MKVGRSTLRTIALVALSCCYSQTLLAQGSPSPYLFPQEPPDNRSLAPPGTGTPLPMLDYLPPAPQIQDEPVPDSACSPEGCFPTHQWMPFPETHLWEPPLANPMQPRIGIQYTSLQNASTTETVETVIGGTFNFWRISPWGRPDEGIQFDAFAVAYTRFAGFGTANAMDYRFGFPITFASGPWEGKIGYEHTSSHLGDDFIALSRRFKKGNIRDELVFAVGHRWGDRWRVYGEMGTNFNVKTPDNINRNPFRFNFGVEWSPQFHTGIGGKPYAAVDLFWLGTQDFHTNLTVQVGWQWRTLPRGRSTRLVLEYYNGMSRYGQFFLDREEWIGFGWVLDF